MFTLIEQGEVYAPEHLGKSSVLLNGGTILKIGEIDASIVEQLGLPLDVIDASGCVVTPGLIDPHQHLLGGSGEEGFSSQTPEINVSEIVSAGITTVVGCLGADTTMTTMAGLLARAKVLKEEGLSAFIWSGGLIGGVIIDQHFMERGRVGRLLGAVAQNPKNLGIGIDEQTAIVVERENGFYVLGSGAVYVIDGTEVKYSNIAEEDLKKTLSIYNVRMHMLSQGDRFDLIKRAPRQMKGRAAEKLPEKEEEPQPA